MNLPKLPNKAELYNGFLRQMTPIHYPNGTKTTGMEKFTFIVDNLFYFGGRKLSVMDVTAQGYLIFHDPRIDADIQHRTALKFEKYIQDDFLQACKLVAWIGVAIGAIVFPEYRKKILIGVALLFGVKVLTKVVTYNKYILDTDKRYIKASQIARGIYIEYRKVPEIALPAIPPLGTYTASDTIAPLIQLYKGDNEKDAVNEHAIQIRQLVVEQLKEIGTTRLPQFIADKVAPRIQLPEDPKKRILFIKGFEKMHR